MSKSKVEEQKITKVLEENYMPYAMSVIMSRALPEIDGFKPAHRKLLYTMYKMKLINGNRTKSANVVGQTMKLNPHGDQAIYATMVRMTRGYDALLHPYVNSKGNFGKHTSRDMAYAASRYTEVKLSDICQEIFRDIDKHTVDFVDNYDGRLKEPRLLPTSFPNILVHANKGIAVGMANSMCSFNLKEVCELTKAYMKNEDCDVFDYLNGPDFSTGGYVIKNDDDFKKVYDTGRGSFKLQAKYTYNKEDNAIEITEIPYTTSVEAVMDKILQLIQSGKVKDIQDMRDETDLKGLKLTIDLKKNVNSEKFMKKMFAWTPLRDNFTCNFNVLIKNKPRVMGIKGILKEWIEFRIECLKKYLGYMIGQKEKKLHLLLGLDRVLLDIDKAIKIIRDTESDDKVVPNLMQAFHIDEVQAEYVADIKLRNLNRQYLLEKTKEIVSLRDEIDDMQFKKQSEKAMKRMISKDLDYVIKKYARDRKTKILENVDLNFTETQTIENYKLKIFVTEHGYIKKIPLTSLRAYSNHKLKEDDEIRFEHESDNHSELLCFTSNRNVYKIKIYELKDDKASSLGQYVANVFDLEDDEQIVFTHVTKKYDGKLLFCYNNGKIAKVPVNVYQTKSNRKKLVRGFSDKAEIISVAFISDEKWIMLERTFKDEVDRTLVVSTEIIPEKTTRTTQGIQVMRLRKNAIVSRMCIIEENNLDQVKKYLSKSIPVAGHAGSIEEDFSKNQLNFFDMQSTKMEK